MFKESKDIEFKEEPILDFKIHEICLLFSIEDLITFKSLKRKIGAGFPIPNGSIFFKSS